MIEEEDGSGNKQSNKRGVCCGCFLGAVQWLKMLTAKTHWSFIYGVVSVYGINQGLGGAMSRVGMDYYFKDVQKIQPSEAQIYAGVTSIPWIVKPLWGLLTDVLPIWGYRRRPYLIFAGVLTMISMGLLWMYKKLHLVLAVLALTMGSAGTAIADVTIDACVAQNSNMHPFLAPDFQSLCALCASIGALLGYFLSGIFVHLIGSKGVFGLLTIPSGLVLLVGVVLQEPRMPNFLYRQVNKTFVDVGKTMWATLKCPDIWRPSLYMYLSFALSLNIHEGMFFWFTDSKAGPSFSQENIGYISSIGSIGSLVGALMYQYYLKNYPFRGLLFWTQLLFGLSGMLDLMLVLRINLKLGIPDYVFAVLDEIVFHMIARLKWMPLLVLSANLCPAGIEGTFFALLMSIDNAGFLSSTWLGGFLLHVLRVTRTRFAHLWLAILIRNVFRVLPLGILFLVPTSNPKSPSSSMVGATQILGSGTGTQIQSFSSTNIELAGLVNNVDEHVGF